MLKKISAVTVFSLIISILSFTQAQAAIDGVYYCSISGDFSVISNAVVGNNSTCDGVAVIPDGVTVIGDSAFENSSLSAVTISDSVTTIGESAFRNTLLTAVTIPDSVLTIGIAAFRANTTLTSVTIGNSVTTIGQDAFTGNTALAAVTIGNSVTLIEQGAFRDAALISVTIPDSVVTIGIEAFFRNTALTSVSIGNSVTTIDAYAFYNSAISDLYIPNSVTTIGDYAFANSANLSRVEIGLGVSTFGTSIFSDTNLSETESENSGQQTVFYCGALSAVLNANYDDKGSVTACGDPSAPDLVSASVLNENSIMLTFTAPTFTGGAPVTQYEASIRNPAGDIVLNTQAFTPSPSVARGASSTLTVSGLTPSTTYGFSLKAINSARPDNGSYQSYLLTATTSNETAQAAAQAAAQAESARKVKEQKELTEILAIIPKIAELTLGLGETTKSLYSVKCVKGKTTKYVIKGAKCPKGYKKK